MTRMMRTFLAGVLAVVGLAAMPLLASPASAHSQLVSSDPRDGSELAAAPAYVRLVFSENLLVNLSEGTGSTVRVVAKSSSGASVQLGDPQVDGPSVEVAWPSTAVGDAFVVSYRVVSGDGHPISGSIGFSVAAGPSPAPTDSPSPTSASPTTTPTSASPTAPSSSAAPSPATSSAAPMPSPASSGLSWGWVIAGLALLSVVIVAVAAALVGRRR